MATGMATHPTAVVIVPGAWHPGHLYQPLIDRLTDAGFPTSVAQYPSLNSDDPPSATINADTEVIRKHLIGIIENEGKNVILLAHSFGGIPGGAAARDMMKTPGGKGVLGLIYLAAFIVPENQSLLQYFGGKNAPYVLEDTPSRYLSTIQNPNDVLFNDMDRITSSTAAQALLPHAQLVFENPAPSPAWTEAAFKGRIAFVRLKQDKALPLFLQDDFMKRSGVEWTVRDLDASHSASISQPQNVTKLVVEFAEQWA